MARRFRKQTVMILPDRTATLVQARRLAGSKDCTATVGARVLARMLTPGSLVLDAKRSKKVSGALVQKLKGC